VADQQAQTPDPTDAVATGLVRLMLSMEALYNRQSRKAGLTAQQAQLLCTAARRKAGLGEIAEVLHCDRSNVSRLLDRVTRRGLAHRAADTRDGRVAVLELSPGGQATVDGFEADLAARLGRLIAGWPDRKRQAAASTLAALNDAIQRDLAEEDEVAEQSADHAATPAAAWLYPPDHHPSQGDECPGWPQLARCSPPPVQGRPQARRGIALVTANLPTAPHPGETPLIGAYSALGYRYWPGRPQYAPGIRQSRSRPAPAGTPRTRPAKIAESLTLSPNAPAKMTSAPAFPIGRTAAIFQATRHTDHVRLRHNR
jgi:DNA-binding MarR family transcriptional regulator